VLSKIRAGNLLFKTFVLFVSEKPSCSKDLNHQDTKASEGHVIPQGGTSCWVLRIEQELTEKKSPFSRFALVEFWIKNIKSGFAR
jgi:hypothetical protein